jgi:hypothetical protein
LVTAPLGWGRGAASEVVGALEMTRGQLAAILATTSLDEARQPQPVLLHMQRAIEPLQVDVRTLITPQPTATATPTPTPLPTATPRPAVNTQAPAPGPAVIEAGPVALPLLALGGVLVAGLIVAAVLVVSARRRNGR